VSVHPQEGLCYVDLPGRRSADPFAGLGLGVSARAVRIAPGVERRPHRHPHSAEVVHVVAGRGRVWQDGEQVDVGPGDWVHVPAGTAHATLAVGGWLELACFFPHGDLAANLEELDGPLLAPPASDPAADTTDDPTDDLPDDLPDDPPDDPTASTTDSGAHR